MPSRRWIGGILAAALVAAGLWLMLGHTGSPVAVPDAPPARRAAAIRPENRVASPKPLKSQAPVAPVPGGLHLDARWGPGPADLGHKLAEEGAPEGPMSFAVGRHGDLWVLDQVNGRVQHFDAAGKLLGSVPVDDTTQDLALGPHGELVTLDRLARSQVIVFDAAGHPTGRDAVVGGPIDEGGAVTGLFVDDGGVFLEREHTDAVRIAGPDGQFDPERPLVPGRPSRDGTAFLRAAIAGRFATVATITVFGGDGAERWRRAVVFPRGILQLELLDTDRRGHLFIGAEIADESPAPPHPLADVGIVVFRLGLADGADAGAVLLPAATRPEEMLRELTVTDDGDVVQMIALEGGVHIASYRFP